MYTYVYLYTYNIYNIYSIYNVYNILYILVGLDLVQGVEEGCDQFVCYACCFH